METSLRRAARVLLVDDALLTLRGFDPARVDRRFLATAGGVQAGALEDEPC